MPRTPSKQLPNAQYGSIALLGLTLLGLVASAVIFGLDATGTTRVMSVGATTGFAIGMYAILFVYLLFDFISKYFLSHKDHTQAYESVIENLRLARAFKWTAFIMYGLVVVAFVVYASRNGGSYTVPDTCLVGTCATLTRWRMINGFGLVTSFSLFVFGWLALPVYVSEDAMAHDALAKVR